MGVIENENITAQWRVCYVFRLCSEWEQRRQEWLLNEAKLFAHAVLAKWSLGRCKEDVIVLYSSHDGVVSGAHA